MLTQFLHAQLILMVTTPLPVKCGGSLMHRNYVKNTLIKFGENLFGMRTFGKKNNIN